MPFLDRAFVWIRHCPLCYRFTLFTRILLAAGFIPTGLVKLLGMRFTSISPEHPIGAFFEAMYQTGFYWRFLGASQVLAGLFLLVPALAHLGAAMFLPIMLNIFVITVSMGFGGTPFVTGPMVLAVTFLCMWDYDRFRPMISRTAFAPTLPAPRLDRWEWTGFVVFAGCILGFFGGVRSLFPPAFAPVLVIVGVGAGTMALARFLWVWWFYLRREPLRAH